MPRSTASISATSASTRNGRRPYLPQAAGAASVSAAPPGREAVIGPTVRYARRFLHTAGGRWMMSDMPIDVRTRVDGDEERLDPGPARDAIAAALAAAAELLRPVLHL